MKKVFKILTILLILISISVPSYATWDIKVRTIGFTADGHMYRWKVRCISDGSSLSATDLVDLMPYPIKDYVQQSMLMIMDIDPGDDAVAPNDAFTITLYNAESMQIFSYTTSDAESTVVGIDLSEDWNQYLPVHERFYLGISDIGDENDEVVIYFEGWAPKAD